MIRKILDSVYVVSGALAAFFIVAIAVIVLLQVGANIVDAAATLIRGEAIGIVIPSYAEFAGFFLAAASFLALAYTLRMGGHIRVTLFLTHLRPAVAHVLEVWCCAAGAGVAGFFAAFSVGLTMDSFRFDDLSPGIFPVPLWIPQSAMSAGLVVLAIAFADELFLLLTGREPHYRIAEAAETKAALGPGDKTFAE